MFPTALLTSLAVLATSSLVVAAPCDIYASGGTPCIAAHATTRALYDSYSGSLYQVKRASDGATSDIHPISTGGVANSGAQDSFCANTTCLITILYDQSGHGNHLTQAPPGGFQGPDEGGKDNLASAIGAPVLLNGRKVYGVFISPGTGYRNNNAVGTAVRDQAEGMYAILNGQHYNGGCCFDYGNAETNSRDTAMDTWKRTLHRCSPFLCILTDFLSPLSIYFGNNGAWGTGSGSGPWLMADLENGLFSGVNQKNNANDPSISYRFFTTLVKGGPGVWALRGGNAASGGLSTYYSGARPNVPGYNPMSKEGAIILGIGGDNSVSAQGTFYEGAMTAANTYPSDATENAIQANIVAAGYATTSGSTVSLSVGSSISFRATTPGFTDRYLALSGSAVNLVQVSSSSATAARQQASFTVRNSLLGIPGCYSFESRSTANAYIRHSDFSLFVANNDNSKLFKEDSTFCVHSGFGGSGISLQAWGYPTRFFRHFASVGYVASNGGVHSFDATANFNADATFANTAGLA